VKREKRPFPTESISTFLFSTLAQMTAVGYLDAIPPHPWRAPMDANKIHLAETIDTWVLSVLNQGGGDEQLLEGMHAYMDTFKQLLDTCTRLEMTLLAQRYDGFYRFANLLERLAQAIADGDIEVPQDGPLPDNQDKPKKPRALKPKRQAAKQQQIRHAIGMLPFFTEMILGTLHNTEEQYASFLEARPKPHVLDDAIVDPALRLYQAQLADIALHEQQMHWWLAEPLTEAQRYQVNDLLTKLAALRDLNLALLGLLAELKQGTIDSILEMDDEELGRRVLRREVSHWPNTE